MEYESVGIGDVATVSCADFFELQGESVLTCNAVSSTADAKWSSDAPICTKGCPEFSITNSGSWGPIQNDGDNLTVTCYRGGDILNLVGDDVVTCSFLADTKKYTTSDLPTCEINSRYSQPIGHTLPAHTAHSQLTQLTSQLYIQSDPDLPACSGVRVLPGKSVSDYTVGPRFMTRRICDFESVVQGVHFGSLQALGFTQKKVDKIRL
eukprot:sb/3470337/